MNNIYTSLTHLFQSSLANMNVCIYCGVVYSLYTILTFVLPSENARQNLTQHYDSFVRSTEEFIPIGCAAVAKPPTLNKYSDKYGHFIEIPDTDCRSYHSPLTPPPSNISKIGQKYHKKIRDIKRSVSLKEMLNEKAQYE